MADDIKFDSAKYKTTTTPYVDGSDSYANNNQTFISFYHVSSQKRVYFKAFITAFNESFNSDWVSEAVFGRADPIQTFRQNQRQISLNFKVPAAYDGEAYNNLGKIQKLIQFLYPTYTDVAQANTITNSPLVRMKVMNLLSKTPTSVEAGTGAATLYENYGTLTNASTADNGLLGVITNLTVNHNLEGDDGVIEKAQNTVLPKLLDVAVSFTVIHEHPVGWDESGDFDGNRLFPYGVQLFDPDAPGRQVELGLGVNTSINNLEALDEAQNPIISETNSNAGGTDGTAAAADDEADLENMVGSAASSHNIPAEHSEEGIDY